MKLLPSDIPEVLLIEPTVFEDSRGFFFESFSEQTFNRATGLNVHFVQDNHSYSLRGVLRGLHYQVNRPQGKLVRVTRGAIFDVAVDLRPGSPTFGQWAGEELSAVNRRQKWVPPGFAHGFLVTSDGAEVLYKTTDYYAPEHELSLAWNDPALAICWPLSGEPILSQRDSAGLPFRSVKPTDFVSSL